MHDIANIRFDENLSYCVWLWKTTKNIHNIDNKFNMATSAKIYIGKFSIIAIEPLKYRVIKFQHQIYREYNAFIWILKESRILDCVEKMGRIRIIGHYKITE